MAASKQANKHTHARAQCSHTNVGLAHARPNYLKQANHCICCVIWSWVSCFANGEIQLYLKTLWSDSYEIFKEIC